MSGAASDTPCPANVYSTEVGGPPASGPHGSPLRYWYPAARVLAHSLCCTWSHADMTWHPATIALSICVCLVSARDYHFETVGAISSIVPSVGRNRLPPTVCRGTRLLRRKRALILRGKHSHFVQTRRCSQKQGKRQSHRRSRQYRTWGRFPSSTSKRKSTGFPIIDTRSWLSGYACNCR